MLTPLWDAVSRGNLDAVNDLLENPATVLVGKTRDADDKFNKHTHILLALTPESPEDIVTSLASNKRVMRALTPKAASMLFMRALGYRSAAEQEGGAVQKALVRALLDSEEFVKRVSLSPDAVNLITQHGNKRAVKAFEALTQTQEVEVSGEEASVAPDSSVSGEEAEESDEDENNEMYQKYLARFMKT